jgi:hypothetical protein
MKILSLSNDQIERDDFIKSSEIWKILRGLQLLGIECNSINIEELERCYSEVEKSANWVKSITPYDFPVYRFKEDYLAIGICDVKTTCLQANILEYRIKASEILGDLRSMVMKDDYANLYGLIAGISERMCAIEEREGNSETVDEVNEMLKKLEEEAEHIDTRINNGEKGLRSTWFCDSSYDLPDIYLPSTIAFIYLREGFALIDEEYRVDTMHKSIANGEYDFILDWDENMAYEVTDGDTSFMSHKYYEYTPYVWGEEDSSYVKHYYTARLNGFHEYMLNIIRFLIDRLTKVESAKELDRLLNHYNALFKIANDYNNKHYLKKINEKDNNEYKKRSKGLR